jgi:hypothetical protein
MVSQQRWCRLLLATGNNNALLQILCNLQLLQLPEAQSSQTLRLSIVGGRHQETQTMHAKPGQDEKNDRHIAGSADIDKNRVTDRSPNSNATYHAISSDARAVQAVEVNSWFPLRW